MYSPIARAVGFIEAITTHTYKVAIFYTVHVYSLCLFLVLGYI